MDRRYSESLQESLPLLSFGVMRLEKTEDGKIDIEQSAAMIERAMGEGINYFDTAMPYLDGQSELFLGEVLPRFPRESYFLTDKLPIYYRKTEGDIESYVQQQLERCKTDYFDFYLVHSLSEKDKIETFERFNLYDFMVKAKAEGKIRHIGFSFHGTPEMLRYLLDRYQWECVQLQINYYDWEDINAKELYDILEERGIPCFVMEPVKGGFLSSFSPRVEQRLRDYRPDATPSSWALRWVASHSNVATVLSGMSNREQVEDNIRTFTDFKPITPEEEEILSDVAHELQKINAVPCTRCAYCMPCPMGVKIPTIFTIYNNYQKTENVAFLNMQYNNPNIMLPTQRADACVKCGACMAECPQQIQIPDWLEKIGETFAQLGVVK